MTETKLLKYALILFLLGLWTDLLCFLLTRHIDLCVIKNKSLSGRFSVMLSKHLEHAKTKWHKTELKYIRTMLLKKQ